MRCFNAQAGEDLHGGDGSVEAPADALQALLDPRPLAPAEEREEDDDGGNALSARGSYRRVSCLSPRLLTVLRVRCCDACS